MVLSSGNRDSVLGPISQAVSSFAGITTMVVLTTLFIYKLTKVQRSITDATSGECKNLMSTVTKTFILTAASVISYILMDAAYIGQINDIWGRGSVVALLLDHILFALDLVTNFLSIFLGFSYNLHYYMALCGKCHPKCMICLVKEEKINAKADVVEDTEFSCDATAGSGHVQTGAPS
eukprot:650596_1